MAEAGENPHLAYLSLLDEIGKNMDRLCELSQQKTRVVGRDDLEALSEVIKQEQVISLSLRGLEQKRLKVLTQLGLEKVPLSGLAARYPAEYQSQAEQTAAGLLRKYEAYRAAAKEARERLESNLIQVERVISDLGVTQEDEGTGYVPPKNPEPPKNMKTDFRA